MMGGGEDRSRRIEMEMGRGMEGRSAMSDDFGRYCNRSKRGGIYVFEFDYYCLALFGLKLKGKIARLTRDKSPSTIFST